MPKKLPTKKKKEVKEKEIGDVNWEEIEDKFFTTEKRRKKRKKEKPRKKKHLFAVLGYLILYYIANNIIWGKVSFITRDYFLILPWLNISIAIAAGTSFLSLFENGSRFRLAAGITVNLFWALFLFKLYEVFPFAFFPLFLVHTLQILLIFGVVGMVALAFFRFARLVFEKPKN